MKRKSRQSGSITVEYLIVTGTVAVLVWGGVFGGYWSSADGGPDAGVGSVYGAMRMEYREYANVIAGQ